MPGIFPTGRWDDRSLMSSLIARRVSSYESHIAFSHIYTHSYEHSHSCNELQGSQPKTSALYLITWCVHTSFCAADRSLHGHLTWIHKKLKGIWHTPSPIWNPWHPPEMAKWTSIYWCSLSKTGKPCFVFLKLFECGAQVPFVCKWWHYCTNLHQAHLRGAHTLTLLPYLTTTTTSRKFKNM